MTLIERIEHASTGIAVATVSAAGPGAFWLVRRIFTNQKQIEILQQSLLLLSKSHAHCIL